MTTNISAAKQRMTQSFLRQLLLLLHQWCHLLSCISFCWFSSSLRWFYWTWQKCLGNPTSQEILSTITKCFKFFSIFKQHSWMPKWLPETPTDHINLCTSKLHIFIVCVYYALSCSICLLLLMGFFSYKRAFVGVRTHICFVKIS